MTVVVFFTVVVLVSVSAVVVFLTGVLRTSGFLTITFFFITVPVLVAPVSATVLVCVGRIMYEPPPPPPVDTATGAGVTAVNVPAEQV